MIEHRSIVAGTVRFNRSPTSHSYFSKRLRLHYLDWGNEGAPSLIMIHGNRDHCHNWDWMADRLADRYHIVAPDLAATATRSGASAPPMPSLSSSTT